MPVLPFFRVQCDGACSMWLVSAGPDSFSTSDDAADAVHFETFREALQAAMDAGWVRYPGIAHCGKCPMETAS